MSCSFKSHHSALEEVTQQLSILGALSETYNAFPRTFSLGRLTALCHSRSSELISFSDLRILHMCGIHTEICRHIKMFLNAKINKWETKERKITNSYCHV